MVAQHVGEIVGQRAAADRHREDGRIVAVGAQGGDRRRHASRRPLDGERVDAAEERRRVLEGERGGVVVGERLLLLVDEVEPATVQDLGRPRSRPTVTSTAQPVFVRAPMPTSTPPR